MNPLLFVARQLITIAILIASFGARAATVTLTAQAIIDTPGVAELKIGPYEVAEVVSFPRSVNGAYSSRLEIVKDGVTFSHTVEAIRSSSPALYLDPVVVAGPATIRLVASTGKGICTVKITPEAYPPDRSILVPPGTNQARITLECSTNLVQWFTATNGVYGPLPEAKFFRVRAEPVP